MIRKESLRAKRFNNFNYQSMICFEQDNSPYQYLYLKERFITLGSYKDSEEMAKRCDEAAINQQAIETGKAILKAGIHADIILHSPLKRAAATATHISKITGIPIRDEPRLIEQSFGIWEGTSPRNSTGFFRAKLTKR